MDPLNEAGHPSNQDTLTGPKGGRIRGSPLHYVFASVCLSIHLQVHREFQDPGPDLASTRPLSTFNQDLEIPNYPIVSQLESILCNMVSKWCVFVFVCVCVQRKMSAESSRSHSSAGTDRSRLGSRSPLSTPLPMLGKPRPLSSTNSRTVRPL